MADLMPPAAAPPFVTVTATPVAGGMGFHVETNIAGTPAQIWQHVEQFLLQGLRTAIAEGLKAADSRIVMPTPGTLPGVH
jgi:hypothetical protein